MSYVYEWGDPIELPKVRLATFDEKLYASYFPEDLSRASIEISRAGKLSVISPLIVGLSCASIAIGKKAMIIEKNGLEHYPSLFITIVLPSGERKTFILSNMQKPLVRWTKQKISIYNNELVRVQKKNEVLKIYESVLKKKIKKTSDIDKIQQELIELEFQKEKIPIYPSLFSGNISEERLFQKMHERGGAYAIMSSEGRIILDIIMGKYGSFTGEGIYLSGISGDVISRDRIGSKSPEERVINFPFLSVCLLTQPDKFFELLNNEKLKYSGLIPRILSVCPPSLVGYRIENKEEPDLQEKEMNDYNETITTLLNSKIDCPHKVFLSKECKEFRIEIQNYLEREMRADGKYETARDFASKATTQFIKIGEILHFIKNPFILSSKKDSILQINTLEEAWKIVKPLLNSSIGLRDVSGKNEVYSYGNITIAWLKNKNVTEIAIREFQQKGPRPRKKMEELKRIFRVLEDHCYLKFDKINNKYIVNPRFLAN